MCKQHLPQHHAGAYDDPRAKVIIDDYKAQLEGCVSTITQHRYLGFYLARLMLLHINIDSNYGVPDVTPPGDSDIEVLQAPP